MSTATTIHDEITAVANEEILVATNSGTFGNAECCRCVGTGDPAFGEYRTYERVGGGTRTVGCDPARAPGRERKMNRDELASRKRHLSALRTEARKGR